MKRRYNPELVVILEPRISGTQATKVIKSWGFSFSRRVEAEGFSGGIWILWEVEGLMVDIIRRDDQFIHCKVGLGGSSMAFTAIYASPSEQRRGRIWSILQNIASNMVEPWLLAGDFNEIKSPLEKKGGGRINETRCARFNDWIQDCNLIDIEANGPFFTWKGPKWEGLERVYKRLDRCLCNAQWQGVFQSAEVNIIPRLSSDHHPLLINLHAEVRERMVRPFKFEAMWLIHDQFKTLVQNNWRGREDAHVKLNCLQQELISWNRDVFGRVEFRKRRLLNRLNGDFYGSLFKENRIDRSWFLTEQQWGAVSQEKLHNVGRGVTMSEVLCGKYGRNKDLKQGVVWRKSDSEVWKNLARIWPSVVSKACWEVGNGREISFWSDVWLGDGRKLIEKCLRPLENGEEKLMVSDMVNKAMGYGKDWGNG
ncbi:hypothetical protein K1719_047503 [Acacia pycnantha]|nr:hypothetical protein K1719_047503 [Acacia pycnantha]